MKVGSLNRKGMLAWLGKPIKNSVFEPIIQSIVGNEELIFVRNGKGRHMKRSQLSRTYYV